MIVIGLLIGAVLKGQELIENARVVNFASQIKKIQVAILQFKDATTAYPGDITHTNFSPHCTAANFCQAGNGDGWVGMAQTGGLGLSTKYYTDSETAQFWKHLAMMDMIDGVRYTANPATPGPETTHPTTIFGGAVEIYHEAFAIFNGPMNGITYTGQMLRFTQHGLDPVLVDDDGNSYISPHTVAKIDRKIDDGSGVSGNLLVWDYGNHGCDNRLDGSPGFEESSTEKNCVVFYRLER